MLCLENLLTGLKVKQLSLENQMVKGLWSDNGSEYVSNDFEYICNNHGIQLEPTIPHSPQQNRVAKRINPVLVETA